MRPKCIESFEGGRICRSNTTLRLSAMESPSTVGNMIWCCVRRAPRAVPSIRSEQKRRLAGCLGIAVVALRADGTELAISSDFPGGSAEVLAIDSSRRLIELAPRCEPGYGWPCWWYARVDGGAIGETVTVRVTVSTRPYRNQQVLRGRWALPDRAAISTDHVHWSQTPAVATGAHDVVYAVVVRARRFWIAWGPPFLPAHAEAALMEAALCPGAEVFTLARTREGRDVRAIRLGNSAGPAVWVQARQHAWEVGSSWVARGLLEWAVSNDPEAIEFRRRTELWLVPIMDVDNVMRGSGGKEAEPRDHNRDWDDSPIYPEVIAAQQRLRLLMEHRRLRIFVDLHQPGWEPQRCYLYGPPALSELPVTIRKNYEHFLCSLVETATGPLKVSPNYQLASHIRTEEERARTSRSWVQRVSGGATVSVTLETCWNLPASTVDNYRQLGAELGRAILRHVCSTALPAPIDSLRERNELRQPEDVTEKSPP